MVESDKRTLVIGNKNYSSWSLRAWLALAHSGLPFEEVRIGLNEEDTDEKLARYSPSLKVPVLIENGTTIWDSLAICERAAEHTPSLWPGDPIDRALARSVAAEMHSGFSAVRSQMPMNIRAANRNVEMTPDLEIDINRIFDIWNECRNRCAAGKPWLFGDFSIADAMYAPITARFRTYGVACDEVSYAYIDTMFADSHMQRWVEAAHAESEIIDVEEVGIV